MTPLPLSVVVPELCILSCSPLPLIKLLVSPKKKSGDLSFILLPLIVAEPFDCKTILLFEELICVEDNSNPPIVPPSNKTLGGKTFDELENWDDDPKFYKDMVEYHDKVIGKIVSKLESLNLKDETLIIYAGDNGTTRGIVSMMGDKKIIGGKGLTSDTGTHVPLICNWPKIVPEGTVIDDLVDASDFLPTMLEISDIEHSDITDGRSFYPQIRGDKGNPREWIYFYFDPASPRHERPVSEFVREKKWKLYSDDRMFNVLDDPDEKNIISWDQNEETKATYTKLKKILTNIKN